eukprot:10608275-Alexandrium_andersonii.AAC.2
MPRYDQRATDNESPTRDQNGAAASGRMPGRVGHGRDKTSTRGRVAREAGKATGLAGGQLKEHCAPGRCSRRQAVDNGTLTR